MAHRYSDRVKELVTTAPGTGSFSLAGAVVGFQAFSAACANGDTIYYTAWDGGANWEDGRGTYNSSGNTLSRTNILSSSNSGSAVNFTSGVTIFASIPAAFFAPNRMQATPGVPGTTSSTSPIMAGLGAVWTLTPKFSGIFEVTLDGSIFSTVATDGTAVAIAYGTGAPPSNGNAQTGTIIGSNVVGQIVTASGQTPFAMTRNTSSPIAIGTPVWFDAQFYAVTGGTAGILNLTIRAKEIPA